MSPHGAAGVEHVIADRSPAASLALTNARLTALEAQ